jgi:hypothetical protein
MIDFIKMLGFWWGGWFYGVGVAGAAVKRGQKWGG